MSKAPPLDLDIRPTLTRWLELTLRDAQHLQINGISTPKGGGTSAETVYVDTEYTQSGRRRAESFVLRRQIGGNDLFLNSDLGWQYKVLQAMEGRPLTPVPKVVGIETDSSVLGAPFYVMQKISGRIVPQTPNYNQAGWLAEITLPERAVVWSNAVRTIARVHKIDWTNDFGFMNEPRRGVPGLDQYLHYVEEWYAWAAAGRELPIGEAAMRYLRRNKPDNLPVGLVWGDPTPANILFDDNHNICSLLDWEMAALGPGEIDLAWFLFFDNFFSAGMNVPRLEGLPSREEIVAVYEGEVGRSVRHMDYFEILAMVRLAIVTMRACDRHVALGNVPPSSRAYFDNPPMAMLAQKLELPAPGSGEDFRSLMAAATRHQS